MPIQQTNLIVKNPIISKEAYRIFVSLIFSAGMAVWGTTLITLIPLIKEFILTGKLEVHLRIIVGGVLYGGVLICLFWIYIEKLATKFVPRNIWILLIDFTALSFMAGAASTWRNETAFVFLAFTTIFVLLIRFIYTFRLEAKEMELHGFLPSLKNIRHSLLTQIVILYTVLIIISIIMGVFLVLILPRFAEVKWNIENVRGPLYWCVNAGMFAGILLTFFNSLKHTTIEARVSMEAIGVSDENIIPSLCPAYCEIPSTDIVKVAENVFNGQNAFRHFVNISQVSQFPQLPYHFSRVHAYRDVETQAFIMAYHAQNEKEIELRSMWVYLAHWFDDMFDDYYAEAIADIALDSTFDITTVLDKLDPRLKTLWQNTVKYTEDQRLCLHKYLLELGMRRLILGGPMFSNRCLNKHSFFLEKPKKLILENLRGSYGVQNLIQGIGESKESILTSRYLAYTAKVVVEVWDSFVKEADFDLSMLMNLFYAPGLYYHDSDIEREHDENSKLAEENVHVVSNILDEVIKLIKNLPDLKLKVALRPVPLFVKSFEPILKEVGLSSKYEEFLREPKIKAGLGT